MSEANSLPPNDEDLQSALAAAFGNDAMDFLDDDDDIDEAAMLAAIAGESLDETGDPETDRPAADKKPNGDAALINLIDKIGSEILSGPSSELAEGREISTARRERTEKGPRFVVFEIAGHLFGLPLNNVCEIAACGNLTSLPRTPTWLSGVTNIRGKIFSVTDLRNLFDLPHDISNRPSAAEKLILFNSDTLGSSTAIVVDRILGIRNLINTQGRSSTINDRIANFASGAALTDEEETVLIDPELILGCSELLEFAS